MQIVSIKDNLHEMIILISWESWEKCQQFSRSVLSVNESGIMTFVWPYITYLEL